MPHRQPTLLYRRGSVELERAVLRRVLDGQLAGGGARQVRPAEPGVGLREPLVQLARRPLVLQPRQQPRRAAPVLQREAVPDAVVDRLERTLVYLLR